MSSKKADETNDQAKNQTQTQTQSGNSSDELTAVVEDLLNQLSSKFDGVSSEIFAKMDDMARRLDNLEASLQATEENSSSAK